MTNSKPVPLALPREDGAEPWPGYHAEVDLQFELVGSIVGVRGRSIGSAGELADLLGELPRDTSVHLDPVVWAAGPAPWGVSTIIARQIMVTERHDEPGGDAYPEGWEGVVPGIQLQTVYLPEGTPADHVPLPEETQPVSVHDRSGNPDEGPPRRRQGAGGNGP